MTTLREERLNNGLKIHFADESNRYFGDYHRVCLVITLLYSLNNLPAANSDAESFRDKAIAKLGKELKIVKRQERMGVPTADVEMVRQSLIDAFMENSRPYLDRPEYPRFLVAAELKKHSPHSFYG